MAESFAAGIYNNLQSALAGMNLDLGVSVVPDTSSFTSMNQYINQIQEVIKGIRISEKIRKRLYKE